MSRHPLLALHPEARRRLARLLVEGVAATSGAERAERTRHGLLSAGACGVAGLGLGLGWSLVAGGAWETFALGFGGWLALQAAIGRHLSGHLPESAPAALRWGVLAPYEATAGLAAWVRPTRVSAERLVLAAGVLVTVRHPLSYHLLRRLYGRAYPQSEVEQAVRLLRQLGYLATGRAEAAGVLALTPAGAKLLGELGVPAPTPRPQREPRIATHLAPLFKRLEQPGAPRPMPEPAPARAPMPDVEPPRPTLPTEPPPARPAARAWRRPVLAAAAIALVGAAALALWQAPWPRATRPMQVMASLMPHSRGTALQFNGRGLMLSSFEGGLFLSIPDRLDYKRPLSFRGYDMATDCGLLSQPFRTVSMSPHGRFLLAEMGAEGAPRERCLVDLETKTVTHDMAARDPIYGLPTLVGWSGAQGLVLSEEPAGRRAERWWWIDVTSGQKREVPVPRHARVLPLPGEGGTLQALGLDMRQRGLWDLTTYWLDDQREYRKIRRISAQFPEALKEAEPIAAALSPDKRYVLMTLRRVGAADQAGALLVIELESGQSVPPHTAVAPLPDRPIFWGPEARGGRYRFYFNGETPDGVSPWTGELSVGEP